MLLCLDAGNTRLKWGLHDGRDWLAQDAVAYAELPSLALPAVPERIIACNVAGAAGATAITALAARLAVPLDGFRSSARAAGIINGYADPERLGADRWAALIGARQRHAGAALVVMAGTATTIDGLTADGRHLGGLILPGLVLMRRALFQHTADLPDARGRFANWPDNTDDAITSGALHATLGAIERMAATVRRPAGADFLLLVAGGAGEMLLPHLTGPVLHAPQLVLEGLARFSEDRPVA